MKRPKGISNLEWIQCQGLAQVYITLLKPAQCLRQWNAEWRDESAVFETCIAMVYKPVASQVPQSQDGKSLRMFLCDHNFGLWLWGNLVLWIRLWSNWSAYDADFGYASKDNNNTKGTFTLSTVFLLCLNICMNLLATGDTKKDQIAR